MSHSCTTMHSMEAPLFDRKRTGRKIDIKTEDLILEESQRQET